jgi:mitosis protein DIM1
MDNKQEVCLLCVSLFQGLNTFCCKLIDIIETVYRGASKGRGLVVSPKGALLLVCPVRFVKLTGFKRLLDTLQVLTMCQSPYPLFPLCH